MLLGRIFLGLMVIGGISSLTRAYGAGQITATGDVARGEALVEGKDGCLSCHRVADQGSRLGPDLSTIGTERTVAELKKAIFEPNPQVQPQNRLYRVVTRSGAIFTGKLLNQDMYSVQMLGSKDRLLAWNKADLREYDFTATRPMPSYRDKLNATEQAELIAYLTSLKGVIKQ
jgi:putative heme-binding domain-containing protein